MQSSYHSAWYSVLDPVVEAARQLHTPKVWEDMSPKLYATFWVLSLYDLYVPAGRYEDEIRKAREAIKDIDEKSDIVSLLEYTRVCCEFTRIYKVCCEFTRVYKVCCEYTRFFVSLLQYARLSKPEAFWKKQLKRWSVIEGEEVMLSATPPRKCVCVCTMCGWMK